MSTKGFIKLGQNTKSHATSLRALGYESHINEEGDIETVVEGFVSSLDLSAGSPEPLMDVIGEQKALTYGTKVTLTDPETGEAKAFTGVPMCLKLGAISKRMGLPVNLSCLVMKSNEGKAGKAPSAPVPPAWANFAQLLKAPAKAAAAAPPPVVEEDDAVEAVEASDD